MGILHLIKGIHGALRGYNEYRKTQKAMEEWDDNREGFTYAELVNILENEPPIYLGCSGCSSRNFTYNWKYGGFMEDIDINVDYAKELFIKEDFNIFNNLLKWYKHPESYHQEIRKMAESTSKKLIKDK